MRNIFFIGINVRLTLALSLLCDALLALHSTHALGKQSKPTLDAASQSAEKEAKKAPEDSSRTVQRPKLVLTTPMDEFMALFEKYGIALLRPITEDKLIVGCGNNGIFRNPHEGYATINDQLIANPTVCALYPMNQSQDTGFFDYLKDQKKKFKEIIFEGVPLPESKFMYTHFSDILEDGGHFSGQFVIHLLRNPEQQEESTISWIAYPTREPYPIQPEILQELSDFFTEFQKGDIFGSISNSKMYHSEKDEVDIKEEVPSHIKEIVTKLITQCVEEFNKTHPHFKWIATTGDAESTEENYGLYAKWLAASGDAESTEENHRQYADHIYMNTIRRLHGEEAKVGDIIGFVLSGYRKVKYTMPQEDSVD